MARQLFAEKGFEGTSIEEIAYRAVVSKPVVYEHFGGKEGLYAVVVDREMRVLLERIVSALSAGHPRERLEQAALGRALNCPGISRGSEPTKGWSHASTEEVPERAV